MERAFSPFSPFVLIPGALPRAGMKPRFQRLHFDESFALLKYGALAL